jgi:hypothetical protein
MGKFWKNLSEGLGSSIGGSILGMAYDQATMGQQNTQTEHFMDLQHQNNLDLMAQQFQNQTGLNAQAHQLQYEMWLKTNYPEQVNQMKKAGLNPALMYKGAGPGGTTGSVGAGSAAMGSAGLGMAAKAPQFQLYGAQANLLKEQAREAGARADKTAGADTVETESRTALNEQQTAALANKMKLDDAQIKLANANTKKIMKEMQMNYSENFGTNFWVNAERTLRGDLDIGTYIGAATMWLGLLPLRNPGMVAKLIPRVKVKGFVKKADNVAGTIAKKAGIGAAAATGAYGASKVPEWLKETRKKLKSKGGDNRFMDISQQRDE